MKRVVMWVLLGGAALVAIEIAIGNMSNMTSQMSAAIIVKKNVTARGGLAAWRKIHSMIWYGHIVSAHASASRLPFVLEMKRPHKARFEIEVKNQIAARIYDGRHGWKLRSGRDGLPTVQPFTRVELKFAQERDNIDGQLIDYVNKGITISKDGVDKIDGHMAYRLSVKLPSGTTHHVWIDAKTFLDVKYDREARNAFGQTGIVAVFNRDFRIINGVQIPFLIESGVGSGKTTDKMVIDKIIVNPPLSDRQFSRPNVPPRRSPRVTVEATPTRAFQHPGWPAHSLTSGVPRMKPRIAGIGGAH